MVKELENMEQKRDMKKELKVLEWRGHQKPQRKLYYYFEERCERNKTQICGKSHNVYFLTLMEYIKH